MDYLAILERADRAIHSVAQTHLTEFEGTVDLYPAVGEGDGSRAHAPERESAPHASPPPLHTDSSSPRRPGIHGVCTQGASE
ncbi:hypothetical protein [Haloplanus rubicundus]|uniref:hypothetical protein n=1 Tax=Haloplanus rubicundus TaxID=1547898 RepID=UPI00165163EC|nr:hypothetical protein [Haloplanus rubicundus]